ncbi:MAG: uracil-DNA glycosylase [Deltaproteobacteria bacterium]
MPDQNRRLRQQLESFSRAGLQFLPRRDATLITPVQAVAAPAVAVRGTASLPNLQPAKASMPQPKSAVSEKALSRPAEAKSPPTNADGPILFESASPPRSPGSVATLAERQKALAILDDKVKACTRCRELADTRTQTVFGVGNPQARILFIGEAPGADEDAQGEPFVGRAGKLLNDIIAASRLKREELYICNVLKCRPPANRAPAEDECANCREYLDGQLATIDPEYIVCWGAVAAQNLLKTTFTIGKLRGRFLQHGRAKVLCTYHPSYLLRNPAAKKDVWQDMQFLMADMGVDLKSKP